MHIKIPNDDLWMMGLIMAAIILIALGLGYLAYEREQADVSIIVDEPETWMRMQNQ